MGGKMLTIYRLFHSSLISFYSGFLPPPMHTEPTAQPIEGMTSETLIIILLSAAIVILVIIIISRAINNKLIKD